VKTKPKQSKPYVLTAAEREQLFLRAVERDVQEAADRFAKAKFKFIEDAAKNPSEAIRWAGDEVVAAETCFRFLSQVSVALATEVGEGKKYANRHEAHPDRRGDQEPVFQRVP